jgi:hypothetical protein
LSQAEEEALGPGFWTGGHLSFASLAVVAVAVITFFGTLVLERKPGTGEIFNEGAIRRSTAASVLIVYLVTVGVVTFFRGNAKVPQVTSTFLTSFTATVGVVLAFFFGSSAFLESRVRAERKSEGGEAGRDD